MVNSVRNYIAILRPHQYLKNLFIFAPLFFAGQFINFELFLYTLCAFICFSLSTSAVYILNDYVDIEEDRRHPIKKYRPLASGTLSKKHALLIMSILALSGTSLMALLSLPACKILGLYIILNICYCYSLKHIAILDTGVIATGFVLRLFIGSIVTTLPLSTWIIVITFLLALFLALTKRRGDVLFFLNTGIKVRKSIADYNLQIIDRAILIIATGVIGTYIFYATSSDVIRRLDSKDLYLTVIFVIIGILRYMQIIFSGKSSGSPTMDLFTDKPLQLTIAVWLAVFAWIFYL
jgi:decaprenyl-phosphate phosphoribosyltransferase